MAQYAGVSDPDLRLDSAYDPAALVIEGWFDPDIIPGTLPVAATSGSPEESLQALAQTGSDPVDAENGLATVVQTKSLPFDATQGIAATSGTVASSLQALAFTKSLVWSALVALTKTAAGVAEALVRIMFWPLSALLDDFNRANENPLSNAGKWSKNGNSGASLQVISNRVGDTATNATGAFWNNASYGPNAEAWMTVPIVPTGTGFVGLLLNLAGAAGSGTWSGYFFAWIPGTPAAFVLQEANNPAVNQIAFAAGSLNAGDKMLVRYKDGVLYGYRYDVSAGTWSLVVRAQTTVYQRSGFIGIRKSGSVWRGDDFGGGALTDQPISGEMSWEAATRLTPTSGLASLVIEALQGIAATVAERWEAISASLAKTASEPWESGTVLSPTTGQASLPVEAEQGIAAIAIDPYEAPSASVVSTRSEPVEALVAVEAPGAADPWEAGEGVAATDAEPEESLGGIASSAPEPLDATSSSVAATGSEPVEALQSIVGPSSPEPWDSGGGLAGTVGEPEESLQAITSSKSGPWESAGSVLITVTQTAAAVIDALQKLAAPKPAPWSALQKIRGIQTGLRWEAVAPAIVQTARTVVEALKLVKKTGSEPIDASGATIAVTASIPTESGQKHIVAAVEPWEALQGVFNVAPDPRDAPGPVFNNAFMPTEAGIRVRTTQAGAWEANQKLARTIAAQLDAAGILRKLGGLPLEALAPSLTQTATAPFEVTIGLRSFVALPLDVGQGIAAVAVLPVHAEGHVDAIGFAIGVVLAASEVTSDAVAGTAGEASIVPGSEATSSTVAAAMAAARVLAASLSTIEDKEAGQP